MAENKCTMKVWDNGDSTECGAPAMRANRCYEHLHEEVAQLTANNRHFETLIAANQKRIRELSTQSG